jgi:predicted nucleic acid-binding protein
VLRAIASCSESRRETSTGLHHGLLASDATIIAMMYDHRFKLLASHDSDFDRIASINRFTPS